VCSRVGSSSRDHLRQAGWYAAAGCCRLQGLGAGIRPEGKAQMQARHNHFLLDSFYSNLWQLGRLNPGAARGNRQISTSHGHWLAEWT
jgi:hypothetical protein